MTQDSVLDTRAFEPRAIQALILSLFDGIKDGESFQIITEDDPSPLCSQLDSLQASNLHWEYLEKLPKQWRFRIRKLEVKQTKSHNGCCGSCSG